MRQIFESNSALDPTLTIEPAAFLDAFGWRAGTETVRVFQSFKHKVSATGTCGSAHQARNSVANRAYNLSTDTTAEDVYFTPNTFFRWRKERLAADLAAIFVDIDCERGVALTYEKEIELVQRVTSSLEARGIPCPTCYVRTGAGIHLYWVLTEVMPGFRKTKEIWKAASRQYATNVSQAIEACAWAKVDAPCSVDVTRVMRVPGSFHGKTGTHVTAISVSGAAFELGELAAPVGVDTNASFSVEALKPKADNKSAAGYKKPKTPHRPANFKGYYGSALWAIKAAVNAGKVKEGSRDNAVFATYVCARQVTGDDAKALKLAIEIANKIGFGQEAAEKALATARSVGYRYTAAKLDKLLCSAGCECSAVKDAAARVAERKAVTFRWQAMSGDERRDKKGQVAKLVAMQRAGRTQEKIEDAIRMLITCDVRAVAKQAGVSERTVWRFLAKRKG